MNIDLSLETLVTIGAFGVAVVAFFFKIQKGVGAISSDVKIGHVLAKKQNEYFEKQSEYFEKWIDKHDMTCPANDGTIDKVEADIIDIKINAAKKGRTG